MARGTGAAHHVLCPGALCPYCEADRALNIGLFKINVHSLKHYMEHKSDSVTQDRLARVTGWGGQRGDGYNKLTLKAPMCNFYRDRLA